MSKPLEKKIISQQPPFMLVGKYLHTKEFDSVVEGFYVGREAFVSVHPEALAARPKAEKLSQRLLFIGQLASLSMPHRLIADELDILPKTVSAHVKKVKDAFEVERTIALARTMFDIGYYTVAKATKPLGLDPQEATVIDRMSYGQQAKEIDDAQKSFYSEDEFRSTRAILMGIDRRTNWSEATSIVLRSIVGGDIGNFLPEASTQQPES